MSFGTITIPLNERACTLALGAYERHYYLWLTHSGEDSSSLRPESRAAIERAPKSGLGIAVRDVTCTANEARDMLDYFRNGAAALTTVGHSDASAYVYAYD